MQDISEKDTDDVLYWRNHVKMAPYITLKQQKLTKNQHLKWLHKYKRRNGDYYYTARKNSNHEFIGTAGFYNYNTIDQSIEFGRALVIPKYRFMTLRLTYTLLSFAFKELNCNYIYSYQLLENQRVRHFTKKIGFEEKVIFDRNIYFKPIIYTVLSKTSFLNISTKIYYQKRLSSGKI